MKQPREWPLSENGSTAQRVVKGFQSFFVCFVLFVFQVSFFLNLATLHVISSHNSFQENEGCHMDYSETHIFFILLMPGLLWGSLGIGALRDADLVCSFDLMILGADFRPVVNQSRIGRTKQKTLDLAIKHQRSVLLYPLHTQKTTHYSCFQQTNTAWLSL